MKYTRELLENAVKKTDSIYGVMRLINCPISGGGHCHISNRLKKYGIDTSHFKSSIQQLIESNQKRASFLKKKPEDILCKSILEKRIKRKYLHRALQEIGREYKCEKCEISSYNNCPITLEIDHIDGDWKNNVEDNLRYLCPNCHSQTSTSYRKNMKITDEEILIACNKHDCISDIAKSLKEKDSHSIYPRIRKVAEKNGVKIYSYLEKYETKCNNKPKNPNWRTDPKPHSRKVVRPSKEELEKFIETTPLETLGKNFGVSGNAVKKWCKSYGIKTKPPGYWAKMNFSTNILDSIK